jgi:acetoin:2,6-dichlorophenolindophenol oxidoreductase subunit beta
MTMTQHETLTLFQAVGAALDDAMRADDKVLVFGEDVADREGGGVMGVTRGLSAKYGNDRVCSTPISEQAIIGAAIGAALGGYKPVAEIMLMNFATVAMDMLVNHAAKLRFMSGGQTHVPLVVRTLTGSGFSLGGQHSDYLEAWFAHVGGIKVVAPSNPADAYGLMLSAIDDPDPVVFIENIQLGSVQGVIGSRNVRIPIGTASVVRPGTDVTVVAHSRMTVEALAAATLLEKDRISVEIIDLRTVSPWDRQTVMASVAKTKRALVVHEAAREFGIGGEIAAEINQELFGALAAPVGRLGGAKCAVPFSQALEAAFAPNAVRIVEAVRSLTAR